MPYMDQAGVYNQLNLNGPLAYDNILNDGRRARQFQVDYARCPSDPEPDRTDWAVANYSGSLGSQAATSANAACQPWLAFAEAGTAGHGNTCDPRAVSGMFSRQGAGIIISSVTDGTSNTIFVGEILPGCNDHTTGWWNQNGMGNAHATTTVPINNMTTCNFPDTVTDPACTAQNNWNYSWGFRSRHEGGAHFLLVDGSTRFLNETIDHDLYQRLGGRKDGKVVDQF